MDAPSTPPPAAETAAFRAGFACFVGRPNAGKSTLTNALVGTKVAITSNRPQTTRHTVRGIVHRPDAQLVLVDTPGLHKPRTLLGERLNDVVRTTWAEVDVIGFCLPADQKIGPGDRFIAGELARDQEAPRRSPSSPRPTWSTRERLAEQLIAIDQLGKELGIEWAEIVPVSAVGDPGRRCWPTCWRRCCREGPPLYPEGDLTDEPEQVMVAELIREAALEGVRDELPHSIAVVVEEMIPREDRPADRPLLDVHANALHRAAQPEGHRHRPEGRPAEGGRHDLAQAHRGAARHPRLPRPAREGRQGLAARPEAAAQARLLGPHQARFAPLAALTRTLSPCLRREVPPALPESPGRTATSGFRAPDGRTHQDTSLPGEPCLTRH